MVSLTDIAPASEVVDVRGVSLEVTGVSIGGLARLMTRFPDLRAAFSGREVKQEELLGLAPEIINAIIAEATGSPGDKKAEAVAGRLSLETQTDILEIVVRLTMPSGVGPFVKKLERLGGVINITGAPSTPSAPPEEDAGTEQPTRLRRVSKI